MAAFENLKEDVLLNSADSDAGETAWHTNSPTNSQSRPSLDIDGTLNNVLNLSTVPTKAPQQTQPVVLCLTSGPPSAFLESLTQVFIFFCQKIPSNRR